ncbi:hypothetical protein N9M33_03875 [Candidatus Pelagibacter bacterium]|jgi:hypothetical protein|nr:hypothetical protein [Candidatus Pelagibacter bacterium]MDB4217285.1 hypothetical protein [Candidatus Pelagibacter sp.]
MNINKKKLLVLFLTLVLCQFQLSSLKAEEVKSIDDEELPAIDPFAVGTTGSTNQSIDQNNSQQSSNNGLLNNMRLTGTIIGENNQIAVFSSPDGGAFKFEVGELITNTTEIIEIFTDVVIIKDKEDNKFQIFMNNIVRPVKDNL